MLEECLVLENGFSMRFSLQDGGRYILSLRHREDALVEYKGEGRKHLRSLRGRESAYQFKSVEKLRYDFERDAEDALRQG